MNCELRPYQKNTVKNVWEAFDKGERTALVVLPTGCGKTICMAAIIEEEVKRGGRVLLLAHRNSLLVQGQESIEATTGLHVGFEGGKEHPTKEDRIVVSSVQTLSREERLHKFHPKAFSLIMVDEAHHIPAQSYKTIIEYFSNAKLLGVTATPKRGDKTDVSDLFGTVCSEYTLTTAIQDGWLSPIKIKQCPISIDVSNVRIQSGDYSVSEIGEALLPYLDAVVDAIIENAGNRKTIIFTPLVSTAKGMVELFQRKGIRADYVAGERKDSDEVMESYRNGEINILINALLLTEGYNEPSIDCVVNLRLTKSESLLLQMIGRGTRLSPGKENLLVLDFLWNDKGRRKSINLKTLIAAEDTSISEEDIDDIFTRCITEKNFQEEDILEAISRIKKDVKEQREESLRKALQDRQYLKELQERKKKEKQQQIEFILNYGKTNALYKEGKEFDLVYEEENGPVWLIHTKDKVLEALGLADFICNTSIYSEWQQEKATEKQIQVLKDFGIDEKYIYCKGQASYLLDNFFERRKEGLCSYKQAKMLFRYKVENLDILDGDIVKKAMNTLAKNKWKPTKEFWDIVKE